LIASSNLVGCITGMSDDLLLFGGQLLSQARQGGLDDPGLEHHPRCLTKAVEFSAIMKLGGIDSVGGERSVNDGTSSTLMIGEHVLTSVSHAAGTSVLEFSVENFSNNAPAEISLVGVHALYDFDLII
jgi:hypothetical protein